MKIVYKEGDILGKLIFVRDVETVVPKVRRAEFICPLCSTKFITIIQSAKQEGTTSCGCYNRNRAKTLAPVKHGHSKRGNQTSEYATWGRMLQRCLNKNTPCYNRYGGRGITVCEDWLDFNVFFRDMGSKPFKGAQLDRVDNNKGYFKENCRWTTSKINCNNRRSCVNITWNNQTKTLTEWSETINIPMKVLRDRISRYNWSIERAFTTPLFIKKRPVNAEKTT